MEMMGSVSGRMRVGSAFTRQGLHFPLCFCASLIVAFSPLRLAHAESASDSLRLYAVKIVRHPGQSWTGYGIYLGNGLVITAAHVTHTPFFYSPRVLIGGLDLWAKVIKKSSPEQEDLALLSVDKEKLPINLQMRRMPLCEMPPWPGEPVVVAIPESTARSRIMSPQLLPPHLRTNFGTVISDVASTGNSGSGVFDAARKCLLGIMSRKIQIRSQPGGELKDLAKYFVPASTIAAFIPAENHF